MAQKRPVAPDTPITSYPTPKVSDVVITVDVDSRLPGYKPLEYGEPYYDQTRFPGAKLISQAPLDDDRFVRRIYATDRVDQDAYNYAIKYSAGSPDHPVYTRTYLELRETYAPLPDGAADPLVPGAFLVDEEAGPADAELSNLYLKVIRVYETLPGPVVTSYETNEVGQKVTVTAQRKTSTDYVLPAATATKSALAEADGTGVVTEQIRTLPGIFTRKQFSAERPDMLPQKFRAAVPDVETSEIIEGTATQPSLLQGDISASETQQTLFLKQVSRRSRTAPSYPVVINESTVTRQGQFATTVSTLANSGQTADSGPLVVDSQVTDLGDGRSIKVTTSVDNIFTEPSFTTAREDITPLKFRASIPTETEQNTVEGEAEKPVLDPENGDISKTEAQQTQFLKRVSTTRRDRTSLPQSLTQKNTNEAGQLVTIVETLKVDDTTETPSATTTIQSEALGDGTYVVRKTAIPEVFDSKTFNKERPDPVPQKFRAAVPYLTEEETLEGEASEPELLTGDISKSEQQISKFVKRVSTTSREINSTKVLTERVLTPQGQLGTRTLTLATGSQSFFPSATLIEASVEALGDGSTIKTETTVPQVFSNKTVRTTKLDLTPEKFKAKQTEETVEENVIGTVSNPPTLKEDEFSKSEEQITEFVKRTSYTTRKTTTTDSLTEKVITAKGQLAERRLTLSTQAQTLTPSATIIDGSIEQLGDGRTVKTEVEIPELFDELAVQVTKPDSIPEKFRAGAPVKRRELVVVQDTVAEDSLDLQDGEYLKSEQRLTEFTVQQTTVSRPDTLNEVEGLRLEEAWGINLPYKEYISTTIPQGEVYEAEGIDDKNHIVREYKKDQLDNVLGLFSVQIPTSVDLDLPRILKNIEVHWQSEKSIGFTETDTKGAMGQFKGITQKDDGQVASTLSLIPIVDVEFEDIWGKNLPATLNMFFLKKTDLNVTKIRQKVSATAEWPVFRPQSFNTTIFGKSETKVLQLYVSRAFETNDTPLGYGFQPAKGSVTKTSVELRPVSINIPPCLSGGFTINEPEKLTNEEKEIELAYEKVTVTTEAGGKIDFPEVLQKQKLTHEIEVDAAFMVPRTTPMDVPRSGKYIISSSAEAYKFGWFLLRVVTLDASVLN